MLRPVHDWIRGSPGRFAGLLRRPAAVVPARSRVVHGSHAGLAYRLFLPSVADGADVPLLMMLHGCTQTAEEFAAGTRMDAVAERHGCAVLYPEQSRRRNALGCWNWFTAETLAGRGDADLLIRILRQVLQAHRFDPSRVYVAGLSAGGAMAAALCATHGSWFAAGGVHSGLMYGAARNAIEAAGVMQHGSDVALESLVARVAALGGRRYVPLIVIHGSADRTVDPVNAEQLAAQAALLAKRLHPAAGTPLLGASEHVDGAGRPYRRQELRQGPAILMRSLSIDGLGHAWSGGDAHHRYVDGAGPDASELVLTFLLEHRLPDANTAAPSSSGAR